MVLFKFEHFVVIDTRFDIVTRLRKGLSCQTNGSSAFGCRPRRIIIAAAVPLFNRI